MNKRIQRLENGLLVMLYDDDPDSPGDELITPSLHISQDEHYPEYAYLKTGDSLIIKENTVKHTSGSYYPSGYEDLDEFLNSDPGAIDKLGDKSSTTRGW
ncbi:hypothetical protein NIES37_70010 (plasmid) [Tolypothrix tenuis PCC 7101]|uniref:Uncharacterized protein n=1 Tax=Tolypothrix tenuis PCC 7101 TaxID=231146 RepID=A0A1Z4NB83_9CYAN|nr:hypothetical protein [Aulosira sp. FACHB-113]BAZ02988.1 hypothetical protein NIES37_70010 [Tolypothrix tenuis PCC 7101]BAZ78089.1 hypothetical protein NIES50_67220 [Aulosira laxa NIES-50]